MATTTVYSANLTKYLAGGSGDNYIPDGYIKTVEKIWLDTYTLTGAVTLTNTTIQIATLPPNKKLTGIVVVIETSASQTNGTLSLGWASDADAAGWGSIMSATTVTHNGTTSTICFPSSGDVGTVISAAQQPDLLNAFQAVSTGTKVTIALKLNNWTMTTGTIKTLVRYT